MGQDNNTKPSAGRKGGNNRYYQDGKRQDNNYRGHKKKNVFNPASGQTAPDRGGDKGEGDRSQKQKPNYGNQRSHQRDGADNRPKIHRNAPRPEVETAEDISRDIRNIEAEIRAEIDELKAYRASFS